MRMRRKPWAIRELREAAFHVDAPEPLRGHWREQFARPDQPFMIELGCGKGRFVSRMALLHPEINFLAVDKISNILGVCKRAVEQEYAAAGREIDNCLITAFDAERIGGLLSPADQVERLFINFCNPWPKDRHKKHRLTHTRQLLSYRDFLKEGAQIHFKTDDDNLFEESHDYLREAGFRVVYETRDLHRDGGEMERIPTEHEEMFAEQGIRIKFLIAQMTQLPHRQE